MSDDRRPKRKNLGVKLRFEVFKRDKFTCQYCGETAPTVVLQCDHIHPVADGGTNDILNLVTCCVDCNAGKGARLLSDDTEMAKQVAQMAELEERRQQLEMMMQWREELRTLDDEILDTVCRVFSVGGFKPSPSGREDVRKWLKKYSAEEISRAADSSFETYAKWLPNGKLTQDSWCEAFRRTPGVARVQREEVDRPYYRKLFYIRGIVRNKTDCLLDISYLEAAVLAGADIERMVQLARRSDYVTHFTRAVDAFLEDEGCPWMGGRPWL